MKKYYFKSTLMGLLFGFAAKMVDLFPGNTMIGFLGFKDLLNNLGIFIVAICFIEYYSNCIKAGIANSLCFMVSMVISYYCVTLWFFHDFPFRYAALWCLVALCSPLLYLSISLRRKTGYIAILGTLIPNLLLGGEAYKFIHTDCYSNRALV